MTGKQRLVRAFSLCALMLANPALSEQFNFANRTFYFAEEEDVIDARILNLGLGNTGFALNRVRWIKNLLLKDSILGYNLVSIEEQIASDIETHYDNVAAYIQRRRTNKAYVQWDNEDLIEAARTDLYDVFSRPTDGVGSFWFYPKFESEHTFAVLCSSNHNMRLAPTGKRPLVPSLSHCTVQTTFVHDEDIMLVVKTRHPDAFTDNPNEFLDMANRANDFVACLDVTGQDIVNKENVVSCLKSLDE